MKWFLEAIKKYADFKGRARRKEYWMFWLFGIIFEIAAIILDSILGLNSGDSGVGTLYPLYLL